MTIFFKLIIFVLILLTGVNIIGWKHVFGVFTILIAFDLIKFIIQSILISKRTQIYTVLKEDDLKKFLTILNKKNEQKNARKEEEE
tara:strand:+ start:137 stop:394 length:258 start_codon:yes stop_codon:yes gene_type:complete